MTHISITGNTVSIKVYSIEGMTLGTPITISGEIEQIVKDKTLPLSYGYNHGLYFLSKAELKYIQSSL